MHLASFYGPHTGKGKRVCEQYLDAMTHNSYLIVADYNGTTHASHTTTVRANVWPWLAAKEKAGSLVDLLLPHTDSIPYTRVRRFAGTKSYIDRAYGTRLYHNSFEVSSARVIDFSSVHGASDHDPVAVSTILWTAPHLPETRYAQWNGRDVQFYRTLVSRALQDAEIRESFQDVEGCYSKITGCTLAAMRQVNASRPPTTHLTPDVSDWYRLVKQPARQAKRRSKTFFRRVKHRLLTPPSPSTLPVSTRKIQRILRRNSPWCRSAADYIPWSPTLPDVLPHSVLELCSLAQSARKKSASPYGVPPYLLSILPDLCFSLVHQCLVHCHETG